MAVDLKVSLPFEIPERPEPPSINAHIVLPGEVIGEVAGFISGHGTYSQDGMMIASIAGVVERVNKFVTVRPLRARYTGDVGDVVVGRVLSVQQSRWKVDIHAKQDAVLLLSSINLPGDVRRRRTVEDQLQMRSFFQENDLISAEVQQFFQDGAMSLHTRLRYGKLENGVLVQVPPNLVKRSKSHFHTFRCGVDMVLGTNGYIWLSPAKSEEEKDGEKKVTYLPLTPKLRLDIARLKNCITLLAKYGLAVHADTITESFNTSNKLSISPKDILQSSHAVAIAKEVIKSTME